ncbi:MAG: SWIM zinc finger family protein, partial [Phycisphaerae bacterium]|nr:SWIM zinc finger family protein [Phycisphaerae bacterium]
MASTAFHDLLDQLSTNEHRRVRRLMESNEIDFDENDNWVSTSIFDGRPMSVRFRVDEDSCQYSCTCEQYQKSPIPPCPHVMAALTTAEERGWLALDGVMLEPAGEQKPLEVAPEPSYWKKAIARVQAMHENEPDHESYWPADRQLMYMLDTVRSSSGPGLVIETICRDRKRDGTFGKFQSAGISRRVADALSDPVDRDIAAMLIG